MKSGSVRILLPLGILLFSLVIPLVPANEDPPEIWQLDGFQTANVSEAGASTGQPQPAYATLNRARLEDHLASAPDQFSVPVEQRPTLQIPHPDGRFTEVRVERVPLQTPAGNQNYHDDFQSYRAVAPGILGRFTLTPGGLRGSFRSGAQMWTIKPTNEENQQPGMYRIEWLKEEKLNLSCGCVDTAIQAIAGGEGGQSITPSPNGGFVVGAELRTYRLVVACTGEFARASTESMNPTYNETWAEIIGLVNGINVIWESELSISFDLIPVPALVSNDVATDVWGDQDIPDTEDRIKLEDVQAEFDKYVTTPADYDVGHLFTTNNGGGVAKLGCALGDKPARARSDATEAVRLISHEIGHQFNAHHTWNATDFDPDQHHPPSAVEPGSGRTILSYARLSTYSANNYGGGRLPFFSWTSAESILSHVTRADLDGRGVKTPTGNQPPSITISSVGKHTDDEIYIPFSTPYQLWSQTSDPDGDPTTVSWEGMDTGPRRDVVQPDNGESPILGFRMPSASPSRIVPSLQSLLNNTPTPTFEPLPTAAREMDIRATVRDQRGGLASEDLRIHVVTSASSQPFKITSPNGGELIRGEVAVTWHTGGTETLPEFKASVVNILLSTDGGETFDRILAAATPNDGSESVILPPIYAPEARIKIAPVDNIFFTISEGNFTVVPRVSPFLDGTWNLDLARDETPPARNYEIFGLDSQTSFWRIETTAPWITVNHPIGQILEIPAGSTLNVEVSIDQGQISQMPGALYEGEIHFIPVTGLAEPPIEVRSISLSLPESQLIERFSTNVRHWQRTEVGEAEEHFKKGFVKLLTIFCLARIFGRRVVILGI